MLLVPDVNGFIHADGGQEEMNTDCQQGYPFGRQQRDQVGEQAKGEGCHRYQGQDNADDAIFVLEEKSCNNRISQEKYRGKEIMRYWVIQVGETDHANQAQAQYHIVPLAMNTDMHTGLVAVINCAVEDEKHGSDAKQHPEYIAVWHINIIADARAKRMGRHAVR